MALKASVSPHMYFWTVKFDEKSRPCPFVSESRSDFELGFNRMMFGNLRTKAGFW
jgi:hypothetical protein